MAGGRALPSGIIGRRSAGSAGLSSNTNAHTPVQIATPCRRPPHHICTVRSHRLRDPVPVRNICVA